MVIQWWPANCKLSVKILGKIKISPFRVALFAMAMLGLTGCTSYTPANLQKDGWKRQNAAQLRAAIPETHFDVGENWMAFYDLGGSAKFKSLTDSFQDSGKWEITSAGKLCSTWIKIREGRKTCFAVWARTYWEKGNAFLIVSKRHVRRTITNENKLNGEYTWKSGNPGNLRPGPFPSKGRNTGASFPPAPRRKPGGTAQISLEARPRRVKATRKGEYQSVCQVRGIRSPLLLSFHLCATSPEIGVIERRGQRAN